MAQFQHSGLVFVLFISLLHVSQVCQVLSEPTQDKQALISFAVQIPLAKRIQWNVSESVCTWKGVQCNLNQTYVSTLRLPAAGLYGQIPVNTLGRLSQLRILSLRSNFLSGQIPTDFSNLNLLTNLYLQDNLFIGEFPAPVLELNRLTRLDLSSNNFSGSIPFAINNLAKLKGLFLQSNQFSGNLPDINTLSLTEFNVSNNNLNGSIPKSLQKFPISAFVGNLDLCGGPLSECNLLSPSPPPPHPSPPSSNNNPPSSLEKKSKKFPIIVIVAIVVSSSLLFIIVLLVLLFCFWKQTRASVTRSLEASNGLRPERTEREESELVVFGKWDVNLDAEKLLCAPSEVFGRGDNGLSCKTFLILAEGAMVVVVKRLKDVTASNAEFRAQMHVLGNTIKHENVVPLKAYYLSRDGMLLVSDYMASGNLYSQLHGSPDSDGMLLNWENRKKIALSIANGIAYLHVSGKLVHGNIKSTNVLLQPDNTVGVSDYGLNTLFGSAKLPTRAVGYCAPEILVTEKVTYQSDVYSFGVLLLELLTGKAPIQCSSGFDLPRWIQLVVKEDWMDEVFDSELTKYTNDLEEMVSLLEIAMDCVSSEPDRRPTIKQVVRLLEALNRGDTSDGLRLVFDDPSNGSATRLLHWRQWLETKRLRQTSIRNSQGSSTPPAPEKQLSL